MHVFTERALITALCLTVTVGCASTGAKAPDKQLRPMNQDLAAWLQRLNAAPTPLPERELPRQSLDSPRERGVNTRPASQINPANVQHVAKGKPSMSHSQHPGSASSPLTPVPATALTPAVAPVVAVATGASTSLDANPSSSEATPALADKPGGKTALASDAPSAAQPLPTAIATTPIAASKAAVPAPPAPEWVAGAGKSLRHAIEHWADTAGWTVVWDADIDYPIAGELSYRGDFIDAVQGIFKDHANASRPLRADAYTRQKLIHVTE